MTLETGVESTDAPSVSPVDASGPAAKDWSIGSALLLFAGFAILSFAVYRPALDGEFVSDDMQVLVNNPFVSALTLENLAAIVDLRSTEKSFTGNYAPIAELLTAVERHFFGDRVFPYHAVNVLFHALNSVLLVAWLRSSRLPSAGALLGGLLFALHPANVEAVAWMSQLKTNAALALSLAALLAFRPAPFAGTLLFAAALLTKASALFALPTAAALAWARGGRPGGGARHWVWVAVWALIFGLYTIPEFSSFEQFGELDAPPYPDAAVHLRSIAAFGSRYLVMAATSYGLSAFHQPEPAHSLLDPWWLAALPLASLLLWRIIVSLRRRSEEAAYWVAAAAAYAPISQIFPFLFPMGDRYQRRRRRGARPCLRPGRSHAPRSRARWLWRPSLAFAAQSERASGETRPASISTRSATTRTAVRPTSCGRAVPPRRVTWPAPSKRCAAPRSTASPTS